MKPSKLKKIIQRPLRFHHQDMHEEITELKNEIADLKNLLQDVRKGVGKLVKDASMRMPQSGDDPWS